MSIGQGANAISQNITFIIKRIEACFIDFYSPQDVIHRLEGTEGARSGFQCFQDIQKLIVSDFLLYIRLLYLILHSLGFFGTNKEYIFALSATNSRGASDPVSLLNFPTIR